MPKVILNDKSEKRFARLPKQDQSKVVKALEQLKISPFEKLNIKKYQFPEGKFYRIRLGNIRLVFEFDSKINTVFVVALDYRGNIY